MHENHTINFMVFQDENIVIDSLNEINGILTICCHINKIPESVFCPKCGSNNYILHGYSNRTLKHLSILDKPVNVVFRQPRLICKECKKTFNYTPDEFEKGRRITTSVQKSIITDAARKQSTKDVASINNVSDKTVNKELKMKLHDYRCELTEVICIDEIETSISAEDKYTFVIGDPIGGRILDVLSSRKQDYLIYYFQTLTSENKNKVKYIVSDLYSPYKNAIKEFFPNAVHIVDRFHYLRIVGKGVDNARLRLMNLYSCYKNDYKKDYDNYMKYHYLKSNGKLLLMNRYSNFHYDPLNTIAYNDKDGNPVTKQDLIEKTINIEPYLEEAWSLLQEFYRIDRYSTEQNARNSIINWVRKVNNSPYDIKEMKTEAAVILAWIDEISNSFILNKETHQRMTNGFIEGKNRYLDTLKNLAYGLKDFDTFRYKIINHERHNK